jgi:hypothetical protein
MADIGPTVHQSNQPESTSAGPRPSQDVTGMMGLCTMNRNVSFESLKDLDTEELERERLAVVRTLEFLDPGPCPGIHSFSHIAKRTFGVPLAMITLVSVRISTGSASLSNRDSLLAPCLHAQCCMAAY